MENQARKEKESNYCNQGTESYQMSKAPVKKESDVNREILVDALKRAYHRKYTHMKPVPFEAVSLCVSDVYIEGAIEVLDRSKGEKDPCRWTAIQSRHDLFKPLKDLDGTRILIDGEPGYGKSTLLRQYAHDFFNQSPESPVNRFSIFVLLPLRELCNVKCIYQAIRSQLPDNTLTADAIKDVINDNVSALLIGFDGFDEYSDRGSPQSYVAQIMNNKLLEQCTAICSTRKGNIPHLPSPTMKHFRLSGFNNDMQKAYIKNAFGCTDNAGVLKDRILRQLQQNPVIDAICKVPLFFVVFAHIRGNEEITENLDTVTGFFSEMMRTLLSHQRNKDAPDLLSDSTLEPLLRQLAELAFNGLCSQNQKLLWEASELNKLIDKATLEMFTISGILVQEEMPYTAKTPGANKSFWETSKTHFRFYHKIFQEFFAALHISGLVKQEDTEHLAKKALVNLNHFELQYVYRFACGLHKATAKIILDLFTKNSKASRIFATLCLLETDSEDKYNKVREYCCSGLVVNHYDSKSLQTSTIQLLQVASHQKIPIPSLELSCCVKSVNLEQETLHLFSGLVISKLDTLEELTLTFTNCVDMAASLLGLFSRIPVLKAVRFKHSKLPRNFDDRCVLSDLESNQCEVSWKNLSLEGKLNLSTGRWENANGDEMTDEDYERMLCEPFSLNFEELKRKLAEKLPQNSCAKIARHFSLQEDQVADIISGHMSSTSDLLDVLEERGYIHAANISRLVKSLCELEITGSVLEIADSYQKSIGTETSYDQFLASLGSHLTLSYPEKLCDHFEISFVEKKEIVESDTPGIALLLTLNKRGSINATTVGKLVEPLTKYKLVQAVAKVKEYQSIVDKSGEKKTTVPTLKDKQDMLSTCIKRKITNLLEVMTPTPWKKSCQWKNQELLIPWELILTSSKSNPDISKNDLHSKLRYEDIFTDSKLKNKTRIILEGGQGTGKTMLSVHLVNFGMTEEVEGAPMVIYLPLKFVKNMTIEESIKRFYIPKDISINEQDIKAMLNSGMDTKYLVLDGLEEYNCTTQYLKSSEVMKIMRKEKYPSCIVILTSSSNMTHDFPQCLRLKLMMFDKEKRQSYIENIIPGDKQLEFTRAVERSSALRDLCTTPLIFAFIVHNMASLKLDQIHMNSVGSIMEEMINIIFSQTGSEYKEGNTMKVEEHSERLSEIAFKGLCRGYQQLQWPKTYFDKIIPNMKQWLNSGLLILEEPLSEGKDQQTIERDATGSDATRSEETVKQSDKFEQLIENETTTKRGKKRRIHERFEESFCREGMQNETRRPPEEIPKATFSSPFGISPYPKRSMIIADQLYPGKVHSLVKFIHKIIQEWFAAKHLFILLSQAMKGDTIDSVLTKHISLIKPADLYIIRFTSYLCPRSCPAIVKSLMDRHRSPNGVVPENILNIAFLCFAELVEQTDNAHTMDTVKLLITEPVIIRGEDSKLLQQSKISVLTYAHDKKIEVGRLKLINLVVSVDCDKLIFNNDLEIGLLHTLNILEVYRWDQRLSKRLEQIDYQNLISYISNLESLKEAYFDFPDEPPAIHAFNKASIKSRRMKIKWVIGSFRHTLDWKTATWRAGDGVQDHNTVKDYRPGPREHDGSTSTRNQMDRPVHTENEWTLPTLKDFTEEFSREITQEWRDIGRKLGLSNQILRDLETNFRESTQDRVREMFSIWTRTKGNEATFHSLKTALLYARRQDLADKITWL